MKNPITQLEQLTLTSAAKSFLRETAKWSFFLSIMGFIGIGFIVLVALFAGTIFNSMPQAQQMPFDFGITMTIAYLIMALLYFFPVLYLFKFSRKIKLALLTKNDETLADAFEMLKSHYKFVGVFTIIMLSLYVLAIVGGIIAGVGAASSF